MDELEIPPALSTREDRRGVGERLQDVSSLPVRVQGLACAQQETLESQRARLTQPPRNALPTTDLCLDYAPPSSPPPPYSRYPCFYLNWVLVLLLVLVLLQNIRGACISWGTFK
jgi:hypothetical protein